MNRMRTLTDIVTCLSLQQAQFFISFVTPGITYVAGLKGDISGGLTYISSTNKALCPAKGTKKGNIACGP